MRISDWSSDVCSSDLSQSNPAATRKDTPCLAILASSLAGSTSIFIIFRTPIKSSPQYFLCTHTLFTYCARNDTHLPLHVCVSPSHVGFPPYRWRQISDYWKRVVAGVGVSVAVALVVLRRLKHNNH